MNLLETLKWRYATKKYSDKKVPADQIRRIVEAINLSASSAGLQPYRLFIVENPALKKQLGENSFNVQIVESSHVLVFAALEKISEADIERYISHIAQVREVPEESLTEFRTKLIGHFQGNTDEQNFSWATKQAYIGLGTGLIAAAELKIDTTPMEGFDAQKFDTLLGLKEKGLKSVVILALGYRDEEADIFAKFKKVRLPQEVFATEVA